MPQDLTIPTPRGSLFARLWPGAAAGMPPIVLLHDSLGSVVLWRDFPERLARRTGRQVVAYDRLGFGRSAAHPGSLPAPDFITDEAQGDFRHVLDHLEIADFVALGHSVGGGMGIGIAARYPTRCKALVTISAQTFAEAQTLDGVRAAKEHFAQPDQIMRLRKYHGDKVEWVLAAWIDNWLSPGFDGWSLEATLRQMRCPVLAIHGQEDEYGTPAHPERIARYAPGPVSLAILPGEGHVPHRSAADTVIGDIAAFLGTTSPGK